MKPILIEWNLSTKQSEQQQRKGQIDKHEAGGFHYLPHDVSFSFWEKLLENFLYGKLRNVKMFMTKNRDFSPKHMTILGVSI